MSFGYLGVNFIYHSLSSTIDKVGFNSVLNGVLLGVGSLMGIPVCYLIANCVPRRDFGMLYYMFSGICSLIIYFIKVPSSCEFCL